MDNFDELVFEQRHKEVKELLAGMTTAMSKFRQDDPELKKLIAQNIEAINNFGKKVDELNGSKPPEVKVETNQQDVVKSLGELTQQLSEIMTGINKRLTLLEEKPIPVRLRAVRDGFLKSIEYVDIEYKK